MNSSQQNGPRFVVKYNNDTRLGKLFTILPRFASEELQAYTSECLQNELIMQ